jgi:hypothetical protein
VIYGSNELGEGEHSNKTFSYPVSSYVRENTVFTLLDDNLLYFNIPFISECPVIFPITCNISILCNNTSVYMTGRTIDTGNHSISDNIMIMSLSQNESCQLNVTFTNTNGISTSYIISLELPSVTPAITPSITVIPSPISTEGIIGIVTAVCVVIILCFGIYFIIVTSLIVIWLKKRGMYYVTTNSGDINNDTGFDSKESSCSDHAVIQPQSTSNPYPHYEEFL